MARTSVAAFAIVMHPGCGPLVLDVDISGSGDGGSESGRTTTSTDGATSTTSHEDPDGDSSGSSGSSSSTGEPECHIVGPELCECDGAPAPVEWCESCELDSRGLCTCEGEPAPSDWCPPPECVLPHDASLSWCGAQRSVAQAIACRQSEDPTCYQTVTAQYVEGLWETVQAGDCSTSIDGPGCAEPYTACTETIGPNGCELFGFDGLDTCVANAVEAGVEAASSATWCTRIVALYVDGCTATQEAEACDPGCAYPCAYGLVCTGSPGAETCTS